MTARWLTRVAITLIVFTPFVLHNRGDIRLGYLDRMENLAYDLRLKLTLPQAVDDRVVIVDIDEKSLMTEGQWPWDRKKLARLVDSLFDRYGAAVVGFDIVFPESDRASPIGVLDGMAAGPLADDPRFLEETRRILPDLEYDRIFAESMRDRKVVLGYVFRRPSEIGATFVKGVLPEPVVDRESQDTRIPFIEATGFVGNLTEFTSAAHAGGFFNPSPDAEDGVQRRVPLLQSYGGALYESLALAVLRAARDGPPVLFEFFSGPDGPRDGLDLEALTLGDISVPVDDTATALVPYRRQGSFPYVSATDVLNRTADNYPLQGAIVLIGTRAAGLHDLRTTPVGDKFPGVEVHANVISGILDERIKKHPRYVQGVEIVLLFVIALIMTLVLPRAPVLTATLVTVLVMVVVAAVNLLVWNQANHVIPVASALTLAFVLYLFHIVYGYFVETRGRRALSDLFGQYVPPELVAEMGQNPEAVDMKSDSRELTVLFTDVRGFTGIAEGLDPPELSRLMNEFLTPMTRVIHRHRGTIDKYMGDAIMAFWGAPLDDPHHARNALLAAFEMQGALQTLRKTFEKQGWPELRIGVGLNTGMVRVGNMGSEFRMAYTVMGDAVNLASRIEGLTKEYGVNIAVGEATKAAVPEYAFLEIDRVRVKGKDTPVALFEPIGPRTELDKDTVAMLARHKRALDLYRAAAWDGAEREFFGLSQNHPDRRIFGIYLDRIAYFRLKPPDETWDGVFTHVTK